MEEFCCGCDNGGESGCMAQFCSREAWRGLPRLFVNSYFSILSTGLQRIGQFSLHFREHKTGPKSLSGLRVQPGPTSPLWKAFGEARESGRLLALCLFPKKMAAEAGKSRSQELCIFGGGKERDQYLGSWGLLCKNISSLSTE